MQMINQSINSSDRLSRVSKCFGADLAEPHSCRLTAEASIPAAAVFPAANKLEKTVKLGENGSYQSTAETYIPVHWGQAAAVSNG